MLEPLQQGDLDGLCGVYAVINAIRYLVHAARDHEFCNRLACHIIGEIYTAKDVTGGGGELKMTSVFEYARRKVSSDLGVGLTISNKGLIGEFATPADAMESTFAAGRPGVFIMGYEGRDSHWEVVTAIRGATVDLFDSCGMTKFRRRDLVWSRDAKPPSDLIIVSPEDLNWVSV